MKKITFVILMICGATCFAASSPNSISTTPVSRDYYCLPSAPTVPVDKFIAPTLVQPASGISATTIESTDGTYFYAITLTPASGVVASLPSCPVRYNTQQ